MPKRRSIKTSSPSDFEPKRKNPISLGSDSNIDNDYKPLKIGGVSTGLEFSKNKILSSADEFITLKEKTEHLKVTKITGNKSAGFYSPQIIIQSDSATDTEKGLWFNVFTSGSTFIKTGGTTSTLSLQSPTSIYNTCGNDTSYGFIWWKGDFGNASNVMVANLHSGGQFFLSEASNAVADTAGYGQLWIKDEDPNELYFTNDDGDDIQITSGSGLAGSGGGDITSVAAGVGLSGGGTTGDVTLTLDMSELTDMTASVNSSEDELIILDNGADRRKLISEIPLSAFNNDSGFVTATLTDEQVQDKVGAMFSGNTETLITATYQDADGTVDLVVDNDLSNYDNSSSGFITATLTNEQVQDIVGAMFTSNTETRISATYQDGDGTIDLAVDDMTANDNTTYAISCVDGDNSDEEKIRLTAGGSGSGTDDVVLEAGTGLSIARDGDKITFTNTVTDTDTVLTSEQVQDIVGAMFTSNTETRISATYEDGDGTIDLVVDDMTANTQLTTEQVQDIVGAMFTSNTETRISATYEDGDGTIDLVVDDMTADTNTTYSAGALLDLSTTTFNVDLTELTDGTADVVGSADELVYLDDGVQKRKQIDEIKLGQFNNDQGWTSNTGDITGVDLTGGTGISIDSETNTTSGNYSATITCNVEGTEIVSTGETGGTKFLREDGDGTCSWQTVSGGGGGSNYVTNDADDIMEGALRIDKNSTATTSTTTNALIVDLDQTGITASGQTIRSNGMTISVNDESVTHVGNHYVTGLSINLGTNDSGTSYATGISNNLTHLSGAAADTSLGFMQTVPDNGVDIRLHSSANPSDKFEISTGANGATTLTTVDDSGSNADLTFTIDGDIHMNSASNINIEATNWVEFDGCGVGFDLVTPTYNASDTNVDFQTGNKQFVTFGSGNITDLNLIFPKTSGNFTLILKQDGSGSRTVTNYKVWDRDATEAAAGSATVLFAGGSNPTLTTTASKTDIISFFYDADNEIAYGVASLNF